MREIKFRAWLRQKEKMLHWGTDIVSIGPPLSIYDAERQVWYGDERIVLMQYTGLKDKNGQEIWEGDTMQLEGTIRGWIEYDSTKASWIVQGFDFWCHLFQVAELEVIGNRYEHPSLLR